MNAVAISKYNNRRTHTEDGWFDSQRELRRWHELKLLERPARSANLRRQVDFELIPKARRPAGHRVPGGFRLRRERARRSWRTRRAIAIACTSSSAGSCSGVPQGRDHET
jgi:hypothetical protein